MKQPFVFLIFIAALGGVVAIPSLEVPQNSRNVESASAVEFGGEHHHNVERRAVSPSRYFCLATEVLGNLGTKKKVERSDENLCMCAEFSIHSPPKVETHNSRDSQPKNFVQGLAEEASGTACYFLNGTGHIKGLGMRSNHF